MEEAGLNPNVVTFTTLVNAYGQEGDVVGAERVLRRMEAAGVPPNIVTYNSVLTAFYRLSRKQARYLDDEQVSGASVLWARHLPAHTHHISSLPAWPSPHHLSGLSFSTLIPLPAPPAFSSSSLHPSSPARPVACCSCTTSPVATSTT